jgi:hypothetical protein
MLYTSIDTFFEQLPFWTIAYPYHTRENRERKGEREGESERESQHEEQKTKARKNSGAVIVYRTIIEEIDLY